MSKTLSRLQRAQEERGQQEARAGPCGRPCGRGTLRSQARSRVPCRLWVGAHQSSAELPLMGSPHPSLLPAAPSLQASTFQHTGHSSTLAWPGRELQQRSIPQVPRPQHSHCLSVFHPTTLTLEPRGKPQVPLEGGHCLRPCGLLGLGAGATLRRTAPGRGPAAIMAAAAPEDSRAHREDIPKWGRSGDQKTWVQDWLGAVVTVLPG